MNRRIPAGNRLGAAIFFILILLLAGIIPGYGSDEPLARDVPMVLLTVTK